MTTALDRPGEIVVDRAKRRAWALPREGVTAPIRLSKGPSLVVAKNVRDVAFEGFVFELALQDGLVFRDTTNVAVRACVVRRHRARVLPHRLVSRIGERMLGVHLQMVVAELLQDVDDPAHRLQPRHLAVGDVKVVAEDLLAGRSRKRDRRQRRKNQCLHSHSPNL